MTEHICGWDLPSGRKIPAGECAVCAAEAEPTTVIQLPVRFRGDPMLHEINAGLLVKFIHDDLFERASLDVDKSVVLYDDMGMFECAFTAMPSADMLKHLFDHGKCRYYSIGVA